MSSTSFYRRLSLTRETVVQRHGVKETDGPSSTTLLSAPGRRERNQGLNLFMRKRVHLVYHFLTLAIGARRPFVCKKDPPVGSEEGASDWADSRK